MKLDSSAWVRIIVSSILTATTIFTLKIIFGMIPEWVLLIGICIPALLNRPRDINDSIFTGIYVGFIAGLLLSVFNLTPMLVITIIFIIFGIIGVLISYFIGKKKVNQD